MADLALPVRTPPELSLGGPLSGDERLAKLVSNGSTRAFGLLYRRHHQALYRYCHAIVRNRDDAEDVLQSAMLRALVALRAEQRDLAVRAWLFRIVRNEALSMLRRRRPQQQLEEQHHPSGHAVERAVEGRQRIATLVLDLQALTERQRSALVMRELSGLSTKEISGALSISPGAAKQALFEARCALQEFAEGRAMACEQMRRILSDGDGRVLHGRRIRAHLRDCDGCRGFQAAIGERRATLQALAPPLPAVAASQIFGHLLAHGADGGHVGGMTAAAGVAVGKPAAASLAVKALAGVAIVTVTAAGGARLALHHGSHVRAPAPARSAPSSPLPAGGAGVRANRGERTAAASAGSHQAAGPLSAPKTPSSSDRTILQLAPPLSSSPLSEGAARSSRKGHGAGEAAGGRLRHGRPAESRGQSRRASDWSHANHRTPP